VLRPSRTYSTADLRRAFNRARTVEKTARRPASSENDRTVLGRIWSAPSRREAQARHTKRPRAKAKLPISCHYDPRI